MENLDHPYTLDILEAVINYENPQNLISPEGFKDKIITLFENGVKKINFASFQPHYPSCSCMDGNTCSECLILSTMSTFEVLFDFIEETNICIGDDSVKTEDLNGILRDPYKIELNNSQHESYSKLKKLTEVWYYDAVKQVCSSCIIDLLVKFLMCSDKITSFLARKSLLCGMHTQNIKTSRVLSLLKQEYHPQAHLCVPLIEILRDMMSQKRFHDRKVSFKTFSLLREINLHLLVKKQFSDDKTSFFEAGGLLEYTSLLCKVIKFKMHKCEESSTHDLLFVSETVHTVLLPFIDYFFTATEADQHLIYLQSIKAMNYFLDIRYFENKSEIQEHIFKISASLLAKLQAYVQKSQHGILLFNFNFVGVILRSEDKSNVTVSALKRQIILLALKTVIFSFKDMSRDEISSGDLEYFWNLVGCVINFAEGRMTSDWLQIVFADQDDQLVTALFCCLIIHRELTKRQNENQKCLFMDKKVVENNQSFLKKLQQTICPHRLFIQLAQFVDYDHLLFSDFLTSPETPFLSYLTQYLHTMIEDWQGFVSVCLRSDEEVKTSQWTESDSEISSLKQKLKNEIGSCEYIDQYMALSEFSETFLQTDMNRDFVELSNEVPHRSISLPFESYKDTLSQLNYPLHNAKFVSNNLLSTELLNNSFQSSTSSYSECLNSRALSNNTLQTSSIESHNTLQSSASAVSAIFLSTALSNDNYSVSAMFSDVLQNVSTGQYLKQEQFISQSHSQDRLPELFSGNSLALVAYSDSDSEDCMTEETTKIQKRPISVLSEIEICEDLTQTSQQIPGSDEDSIEDECTADYYVTDHCMKGNSDNIDTIMGMLIRLRLNIEKLVNRNLFPYNAKPLLHLLETCEELYEKPQGS